jgi:hypothetical protein
MRPRRIDQDMFGQSGNSDIVTKHRLRSGGTADIAHAHEQHFNFGIHFFFSEIKHAAIVASLPNKILLD